MWKETDMDTRYLLQTSDPHYCLDRGAKCYLAVDAAHGGATIPGEVTAITNTRSGADAYYVAYREQMPPYATFEEVFPVTQVFVSLDDVDAARAKDTSLREAAVAAACDDAMGLVLFLLDRADLKPDERGTVITRAKALGLYPDGNAKA